MKPKPQQLDAMVATLQNLLQLPDGKRKQELIAATIETLKANEARGEITVSTKKLMEKLLSGGLTPPELKP